MSPVLLIFGVVAIAAIFSRKSSGGVVDDCARKLVDAFFAQPAKAEQIIKSLPPGEMQRFDIPEPLIAAIVDCYGPGDDDHVDVERLKKCKPQLRAAVAAALNNASASDLQNAAGLLAQVAPQAHLHECLLAVAKEKMS